MINNNEFEFDNSKSYIDIDKHLLYLKNVKDIVDEFKYCKICNVDNYATGDKFYALIVSKTNKSIFNISMHKIRITRCKDIVISMSPALTNIITNFATCSKNIQLDSNCIVLDPNDTDINGNGYYKIFKIKV